MITDPYLTTIASSYKLPALGKAVLEQVVARQERGRFFYIEEAGINAISNKDVPTLTQPLLYRNMSKEACVAVDMRPLQGNNGFVNEQRDMLRMRAELTLFGAMDETNMTRFYQPAAQMAYANLVSGLLAAKFGIDPVQKTYLQVVAAAHYYNMTHPSHGEAQNYDDSTLLLMIKQLRDLTRLGTDIIAPVLERMTTADTLMGLCDNIKRVDDTDYTSQLNPGLIVNGSRELWFGVNGTETMAVALEHAPTFCALLFGALGEGSYSRSEFSKRLKYVSIVRQKAENFRQAIRSIQLEMGNYA